MGSKVTLNGELMFPNDYVSAPELKGKDATVTIAAVSKESLQMKEGGKKAKMVIRFAETPKKLVCNKVNSESIAVMYGPEASKWVGKRVTLYPTRCLAFGEMVECIRVREVKPKPKQAAPEPGISDAAEEPIPFPSADEIPVGAM